MFDFNTFKQVLNCKKYLPTKLVPRYNPDPISFKSHQTSLVKFRSIHEQIRSKLLNIVSQDLQAPESTKEFIISLSIKMRFVCLSVRQEDVTRVEQNEHPAYGLVLCCAYLRVLTCKLDICIRPRS